jgi:hypothetical protein
MTVGIAGETEGVRHPSPHHVDLVRDTHRLTILLGPIEAR